MIDEKAEFEVTRLDLQDRLEVRVSLSGIENLTDHHGPFVPDRMDLRYSQGVLRSAVVHGLYITPRPDPWGWGENTRGSVIYQYWKGDPVPEALRQGISKVQMEDPDLFAYLKRWGT